MAATRVKETNRLIHEKSPYLLQHAHNPVDWYPWSSEALEAAKKLNRPIFLSIGYSTCHWCHVMEHESFENPDIAAIMNKNFINIKVDREERPDLDAIYMESVRILTGGGGWPLSVWMTPDLKPFYGGTYFPPEDTPRGPGFRTLLEKIGDVWEKTPKEVLDSAENLSQAVTSSLASSREKNTNLPPITKIMKKTSLQLERTYDSEQGGFGGAPKFPMPTYMDFLLTVYGRLDNAKELEMVRFTMEEILKGGITDQLGGGFARYSTDAKWLQPHFEKMLYDNAQLISILVDLYQITKNPVFKEGAEDAIGYVFRDLRHNKGAFFSAEDADSEGKEGLFYLWKKQEIEEVLGDKVAGPFSFRYGVSEEGNFHDPHSYEKGFNILFQAHSIEETAKEFGMEAGETRKILDAGRRRLFSERSKRVRPHLDDKVLSGWNGLMILALAKAGMVFDNPDYVKQAEKAAEFIKQNMTDPSMGTLYRRWREGEKKIIGHQIDYALLIRGLIQLFEASGNAHWISWASDLHKQHGEMFLDKDRGGYFMTIPQEDLLVRIKDESDNVIPSGNSIAVFNGYWLGDFLGNQQWIQEADHAVRAVSSSLDAYPAGQSKLITSIDFHENGHQQIVIVGPPGNSGTNALLAETRNVFFPAKVLIQIAPEKNRAALAEFNPLFQGFEMKDEKPTAYVCQNFSCQKPTNSPVELAAQLAQMRLKNK